MKISLPLLLFALSCLPPAPARVGRNGAAAFNPAKGAEAKARLRLSTSVVGQRSCSSDDLSLTLKFTFTNIGKEPIFLAKRFLIAHILVSRNLRAAEAKKYEQRLSVHQFDVSGDGFGVNPPAVSSFILLKPGAAYEVEERVGVGVQDDRPHSRNLLRPGNYFLEVVVGTWPFITEPSAFREERRLTAHLWSRDVTSEPMPFTVEKERPVTNCL